MRYFTRAWAEGSLLDAEFDAALEAYDWRLHEIASDLPPLLRALAIDMSLHDALFQTVTWSEKDFRLEFLLRAGDLQNGYSDVLLVYRGARLNVEISELEQVVTDARTEILYDEVDVEGGVLVHRFLTTPDGEFVIHFGGFEMKRAPAASRILPRPRQFNVVAQDRTGHSA